MKLKLLDGMQKKTKDERWFCSNKEHEHYGYGATLILSGRGFGNNLFRFDDGTEIFMCLTEMEKI